jgi:hypothetical protein
MAVNGTQKQGGKGSSGIKPGNSPADILASTSRLDEVVVVIPLMRGSC